jgi:hypothetical protein
MVEDLVRDLPQNGTEALVNGESRNRKGHTGRVSKVVISRQTLK